ncbi:MAG TPA: biotin--[acetyl-CoA-carboxylase] ligase [Vicinamibacterales bacterium]|nr:biotin--[acetyl-CoA-carboxylase] ligase [Vicinamibacterales bacterium]
MKSNPPDPGRPEGLRDDGELPTELAAAIDRARPRLGRLASTLVFFDTIGSTNDEAARQSTVASRQFSVGSRQLSEAPAQPWALSPQPFSSPEGLVVVADEQTSGRGRRGHTWFSPPGSGLYVSVVLAPATAIDPARAFSLLTLTAGVALAEGIEQAAGLRVDLKWPNDLLVSRRKIGGILAESSSGGDRIDSVVVGYGINVRSTSFPPALRSQATSLETELGRAVDRHHVLAETLAALARRYEDLLAGRFDAILDAWRRLAPRASGARVAWTTNEGTASGTTAGIDDRGALLVQIDDRVERIVSGEVLWL